MGEFRTITPQQALAIKAAFRRGVKLAGGIDAFAACTRISAAQISRCGNPDNPDFPALDVALEADLEAGQPVIAAALASATGHGLARLVLPPAAAPVHGSRGGSAPGMDDAVRLIECATANFRQMQESLADGHLSPLERAGIRERLRDLLLEVVRVEGML